MVIKPMTGHFIPNWAKDASDPKVAGLLSELKQFGTENLYQAFLMWVLKNPNVCCAAVGMTTAARRGGRLRGGRAEAHRDAPRGCWSTTRRRPPATTAACARRACRPARRACAIPDILRFRMYYKNYGHREDAREYYAALAERPAGHGLHRRAAAASRPAPTGWRSSRSSRKPTGC